MVNRHTICSYPILFQEEHWEVVFENPACVMGAGFVKSIDRETSLFIVHVARWKNGSADPNDDLFSRRHSESVAAWMRARLHGWRMPLPILGDFRLKS